MKSPFPGMDPYLEDPAFWRDFHSTFINCWREAIADQLPESYEARLDETINLVHLSDEDVKTIYPDVALARGKRRKSQARSSAAATLLLEPVTIPHEYLDKERQGRIEIRHRPRRKLIAILEFLSPTNKIGDGFEEYRDKRRAVLRHKVHLVELDLLLAGTRPPLSGPLPDGDYFAYISRAERRNDCEVYAWGVREPLPTIPIPLQAPDKDVLVDLGKVFQTSYERGRYAPSLRYGKKPLAPLGKDDAKWAATLSAKR